MARSDDEVHAALVRMAHEQTDDNNQTTDALELPQEPAALAASISRGRPRKEVATVPFQPMQEDPELRQLLNTPEVDPSTKYTEKGYSERDATHDPAFSAARASAMKLPVSETDKGLMSAMQDPPAAPPRAPPPVVVPKVAAHPAAPVRPAGPRLAEEDAPAPAASGASGPRGAMMSAIMGAAKPKPAAMPAPMPPPVNAPQDDGMEAAIASDRRTKSMGDLGKAVTAFTERPSNELDAIQQLGGVRPSAQQHNPIWDDEKGTAVEDLSRRRKSSADAASMAAKKDPNSDTAKTYRAVLTKFAPDLADKLATATPEQMEKIAPWLESYAKEAQGRGDPLGREKLDETIRHNKAEEAKPHGKQPGAPGHAVAAGKYETISDPGERETVRAIVEGRAPAPAPGSKTGQRIMSLVAQIDPSFDSARYHAYQHTLNEQSTNPSINAAKAVTHHMELLKQSVAELPDDMIDSPTANRIGQALHGAVGSDKYTAMQSAASVVASELAQALGEKDVEGRAKVTKLVDPTQTKAQWAKSIPQLEALRDEKLGVFKETLQNLAPKHAGGAVKMKFPNGKTDDVPAAEVEEAKSHGGVPI